MFQIRGLLFAGLLASVATAGIASEYPEDTGIEMAVAADSVAFQYREFGLDGGELNREDGTLPGLRLTLRESGGRYFARADVSIHDGSVDYDGETQRGKPFETDTDSVWRHELTAMAFAVTDGEIDVALSRLTGSDLDDVTLSLGNEYGARLRYTASRPLAAGRRLLIEPYYEYWEFGRSNRRPVTSNGAATGGAVAEPHSESQRLGVAIGLIF